MAAHDGSPSLNDDVDSALRNLLECLAGEDAPLRDSPFPKPETVFGGGPGLGYSQLNELLLLLGLDRVSKAFFQFLVDGKTKYAPGSCIHSLSELRAGVDRFRTLALLVYGNVKYAFKQLSKKADLLEHFVFETKPIDPSASEYRTRHDAILELDPIPPEDTYYLGYVIEDELQRRIRANPSDEDARREEMTRQSIVARGVRNNQAYLASDHLDVYVATSMRERHEYLQVADFTRAVFGNECLKGMKLRFFDPTQAYCGDRIDKGLTEALMLRRATCTIYLAQETDTMGKDSELASTLAQGKPVIAYVPQVTDGYFEEHLRKLASLYPTKTRSELLLQQLRVFDAGAAWRDSTVRRWIEAPGDMDESAASMLLKKKMAEHYDKRADLLMAKHPLGIQVDIIGGVANGVLVVRTPESCAVLLERVLMNRLEFELVPKRDDPKYLFLKEKTSGSIYRVVTSDAMLTNAFWNFYTSPVE